MGQGAVGGAVQGRVWLGAAGCGREGLCKVWRGGAELGWGGTRWGADDGVGFGVAGQGWAELGVGGRGWVGQGGAGQGGAGWGG